MRSHVRRAQCTVLGAGRRAVCDVLLHLLGATSGLIGGAWRLARGTPDVSTKHIRAEQAAQHAAHRT